MSGVRIMSLIVRRSGRSIMVLKRGVEMAGRLVCGGGLCGVLLHGA
jgi:hypothetical protein